jgi:hypothetical protein
MLAAARLAYCGYGDLAGPRLAERYPAASVDACPKRLQHPMSGLASSAACQTEAPVLRSPILLGLWRMPAEPVRSESTHPRSPEDLPL